MVQKQFSVDLDVKRSTSNREFEVVDGDNGNALVLTLTDDGQPVDLTGCFLLAVFSKSDGKTAAQDNRGNGVTVDGGQPNKLHITLYTTSFAPGLVECELQVYSGEGERTLVTSAKFNFMCRRGIANKDTIPETDEWPILVEMLDRVESVEEGLTALNVETAQQAAVAHAAADRANAAAEHAESINASAQAAEGLRIQAEQGRAQAEGVRQAAEAARQSAEAERAGKEAARIAAEAARTEAEAARNANEGGRVSAEAVRVNAELVRVWTEGERAEAENARQAEEHLRQAAEAERAAAEGLRHTAEEARADAEASRVQAESLRAEEEALRARTEEARAQAQTLWAQAEEGRAAAEGTRTLGEAARVLAEAARQAAEQDRTATNDAMVVWEPFDPSKSYVPLNKVSHNGSSYLCVMEAQGVAPPNPDYWLLIAAKGADGEGSGDMLRATYDTDGSGVVDDSERLGGRPAGAYLTQETDPTVPAWAKQPDKPAYTAAEVGAMPATFVEADPTVPAWAKAPAKPAYTAAEVGAAAPSAWRTAVLPASGWAGTPCVQIIAVPGMTATCNAVFDIAAAATDEQYEAGKEAGLAPYAQGSGTLTVRARLAQPSVDIPLDILIVG